MKHTNCKLIGLTGGIASGKTSLSNILIEKGYKLIDADLISRQVVQVDKAAYKEILAYFGEGILDHDRSLNRRLLGEMVFSNEILLGVLNRITHPYIFKELKKQIIEGSSKFDIIFIDIPLLFEEYEEFVNHGIIFDEIWLVYVDEATQLKRLMMRNSLNIDQARDRIKSQIPLEEKKKMATRIIDNNGDFAQLRNDVEKILQDFI